MSEQQSLYKYVTASTGRKILESQALRWSKATTFNDPFDAQFDQHLEFDRERVIHKIKNEIWKIYFGGEERSCGQSYQRP